jgi:hypothetical protein
MAWPPLCPWSGRCCSCSIQLRRQRHLRESPSGGKRLVDRPPCSLLFIGLTGAVLYMLVRDLHGSIATLSRVAIGTFVLFYGAAEAISGVATETLVRYVSDLPSDEQATAPVWCTLWDDFGTGDLLFLVGSVGWVVAVITALRRTAR